MLQIKLNTEFLDLSSGIEIALVLTNPIFNTVGTHSLTFDFPKTDKNKRLFNFAHRLELREVKPKDFTVVILWAGLEFLTGTLKIKEIGTKFTGYFISENGNFDSKCKKLNLTDIDLGNDIIVEDITVHAKTVSEGFYPEQSHAFPLIYNTELYGSSNEQFTGMVNRYDLDNELYFKNTIANNYALCPMFYLQWLLDKIKTDLKYRFTGSFLSDEKFKNIILYNHFLLDKRETYYYVYAEKPKQTVVLGGNENINILFPNNIIDEDNIYDLGYVVKSTLGTCAFTLKTRIKVLLSWIWSVNIIVELVKYDPVLVHLIVIDLQEFSLKQNQSQIIEKTTTITNIQTDVDNGVFYFYRIRYDKPVGNALYPSTIHISYEYGNISHQNISQTELNIFENKISPKNHIPKMQLCNFFTAVENMFGIKKVVNENRREVKFVTLNEIIENTNYIDITHLVGENYLKQFPEDLGFTFSQAFPSDSILQKIQTVNQNRYKGSVWIYNDLPSIAVEGDIYYIESEDYFLISAKENNAFVWKFYSHNVADFVIGDGSVNIETEASRLVTNYAYHPVNGFISAATLQNGISKYFNIGDNPFSLQFLNYFGFVNNASNKLYPYAGSLKHDYNKNQIANIELRYDGEFGLYNVMWEKYCDWYINRRIPVERVAKLDVSFLCNIDWTLKYRILGIDFFINKIETTLTSTGIKLSKLYLLKC